MELYSTIKPKIEPLWSSVKRPSNLHSCSGDYLEYSAYDRWCSLPRSLYRLVLDARKNPGDLRQLVLLVTVFSDPRLEEVVLDHKFSNPHRGIEDYSIAGSHHVYDSDNRAQGLPSQSRCNSRRNQGHRERPPQLASSWGTLRHPESARPPRCSQSSKALGVRHPRDYNCLSTSSTMLQLLRKLQDYIASDCLERKTVKAWT